jgi:YVTN family beta-propeller protein
MSGKNFVTILAALVFCVSDAEAADYVVYVSNERSGDVSVIDAASHEVTATISAGKRPRGIRPSPDGRLIYVALSGSPRGGPGVDRDRAPADKAADGIGVIDRPSGRLLEKLNVGSDPEAFSFTNDGKRLVVANEDVASASVFDLASKKIIAEVKVSEEPEGVATNPKTGEVYVTCEEEGEVYVIDAAKLRPITHFAVGARPRSAAFLPDGSRAFVPSETESFVSVIDAKAHQVVSQIKVAGLPMDAVVSPDGSESAPAGVIRLR